MENFRDMVHSMGNATSITVFGVQVIPFLVRASWLLALPIIVVLVDLWFGINESKQRNETIRFSGACWKTLRKLMDYYTLLTMGFVIGHIIPESYGISVKEVCFYAVLIPSFFDISSILGHILKLKGINLSLKKVILDLLLGWVKTKNHDMGKALEGTVNELKREEDNGKTNSNQKG